MANGSKSASGFFVTRLTKPVASEVPALPPSAGGVVASGGTGGPVVLQERRTADAKGQLQAYAGKVTGDVQAADRGSADAAETVHAKANSRDRRRSGATSSRTLLTRSGVALGIMALASIGLGWLMAGRALRPVRTMSLRARGISERNLHERLALEGPDDELKELANTFDGLLGRLESAFESQRRFVANASHELRTPITLGARAWSRSRSATRTSRSSRCARRAGACSPRASSRSA